MIEIHELIIEARIGTPGTRSVPVSALGTAASPIPPWEAAQCEARWVDAIVRQVIERLRDEWSSDVHGGSV
ncbi:hypothetical protein KQH49_00140 [Mycetohabitans sp. B5]|uniref:Uncharacterized protein n=1 Tax=Mycetohabitans endofungorum TaxID=417203 RepID=A0A2P5KD42_9BURK|nr:MULTISPECIES: DUF5908 family protein [Mycetohabitans]MCG1053453.1 hypothetical protein [Mycetohabitans sp. B5]PPB84627.1 hypothetical protein B0O95_10224 [Mycetohabitans endofungorum]